MTYINTLQRPYPLEILGDQHICNTIVQSILQARWEFSAHVFCASAQPIDSLTCANTVANEGPLQWPKIGRGRKTRVYHLD